MPFKPELISGAVARYRRERDRYIKLADRVAEICREDICEQNAIRAQVTFRVKTEKSFEVKLRRFSTRDNKNYTSIDDIFAGISDLAGVRIATYRYEDCNRIVELLSREFNGPNGEIDTVVKDLKKESNENYYRAIHAQVCLPEEQQIGTYDNVGDISCEIQICTMIAHVWNEIEHDIGYKSETGGPSSDESFYLAQLGRSVRQGDLEISSLLAAHERKISTKPKSIEPENDAGNFIDVHDFVSRARSFFEGHMTRFSENSGQLFDLLVDIDLANPKALIATFQGETQSGLLEKLQSFNNYLKSSGVVGINLDDCSSDLMLFALLEKKCLDIMNELNGRAGRGRGRPTRLHRIAVRYSNWVKST